MQKSIIYKWPSDIENKKSLIDFLDFSKKFSIKKKVKMIAFPPVLYLDFIKIKYTGSKISFGLDNANSVSNPKMLKNLKINYSYFEKDYDFEKINCFLKNSIKLIFKIGEDQYDEEGSFLKDLDEQMDDIFLKINGNDLNKINLVYKTTLSEKENIKNDFQELERIFMFFRKKLYNKFGKDSQNVKLFFSISLDFFDDYKDVELFDGLYIED